MPVRTTKSVRDDVLALDAVSFSCGCDRGTQADTEGVTRRGAEARLASELVDEANGKREPEGAGISSAATVVVGRSSANVYAVSALQLYHTSSGVWRQSTLSMRSVSS